MEVAVTTFGGRVVSLKAPGRDGKFADVVLGFDNLQATSEFTPTSARWSAAMATASPRASSSWMARPISCRQRWCQHAARRHQGFDKVVWTGREVPGGDPSLELTYLSKDGEEGYPGNLTQKLPTR